MKTIVTRARKLVLALCLLGSAGAAMAQAMLTIAEKPLRLVRGTSVYKAPAGTIVQKDDILETGDGSAQLEIGPESIIALGPQTRLYIGSLASDGKPTDVQLLQGWIKLASKGGARPVVSMATIRTSFAAGAVIAASRAQGKDALFADEGEELASRIDDKGKPGPAVKVAPEQYAFVAGGQPLVVQPRAAKDFLGEMPPQFRDRLVPVAASSRAPKVAPVKEREADFADLAPWLSSALPARAGFVARFRPRLKDAQFRKQLEQSGPGPEWKAVLAPPASAPKAADKPSVPHNDNPIY